MDQKERQCVSIVHVYILNLTAVWCSYLERYVDEDATLGEQYEYLLNVNFQAGDINTFPNYLSLFVCYIVHFSVNLCQLVLRPFSEFHS